MRLLAMNMKFFTLVVALMLCVSLAFAQGFESNPSQGNADVAVELTPSSLVSNATAFLNQFLDPLTNTPKGIIQYSKDQLQLFPDNSFSSQEGVRFKLRESLQVKVDSTSPELVRVNVITFPQKLDLAEAQAVQKDAVVHQKNSYGNVLS